MPMPTTKKKTTRTKKKLATIEEINVGDIIAYNFAYNNTDTDDYELGIVLEINHDAETEYSVRIKFPEDEDDDWYRFKSVIEMSQFYKKLVEAP